MNINITSKADFSFFDTLHSTIMVFFQTLVCNNLGQMFVHRVSFSDLAEKIVNSGSKSDIDTFVHGEIRFTCEMFG